ncbi:MAG: hypothetical protein A3A86_01990 [Elusimicrobia bacterium RIFCSPLOWO2_01_FULL_60_11]|nr:MAG: hypothetical protein A3A86_01990 [Elusimicrobia bacterium RIFCSPLOWO2_01_FULL_60_11]
MKKAKVIHIITMLELGGAQGNTLFTVEHLDLEKFDVGLISGPGGIQDDAARKIENIKLEFVPNLVRPISPIKDFLCLLELTKILKREAPDIVHTHSSKAGILGRLAARSAKVPVIIHSIHGFGFNPYQNFLIRWLFITLEIFIAKFTDILVAVSQENIEQGLRLGIGRREQYVLIRSGVDIGTIQTSARATDLSALRKELGIADGTKVVFSAGPFKLQKDPVAFVEVAERVLKTVPQTVFIWSGDGELRPQVEAKIRSLGIGASVKLLGWRKDVPALMALCDIFVLTSLWEGLPRSAVEALILAKPVVAYAVDGVPEIVKDQENGFLIRPGDKGGFAAKLSMLLKDPGLRGRLSASAVKSIDSTFDIRGMVKAQEGLYSKTLHP